MSKNNILTGYPSQDYPILKHKIYGDSKRYNYNIDTTMFEFFVNANKDHLSDVFIEYLDEKITYNDMINMVYSVARSLKRLGIKKNDYIIACMPNTPEVRALIYASSLIGATIHPVDPRTNPNALKEMSKDANLIIMYEDLYSKYEDILSDKQIVTAGAIECFPKIRLLKEAYKLYRKHEKLPERVVIKKSRRVTDWKSFIKEGKKQKKKIQGEYESGRLSIIESTSGTTGIPSGVLLTDKNVNYVALQHLNLGLDYERGDTVLDLLLPSIAYWLGSFNAMQCLGLKTYVMPALVIEEFPNVLKKYKPNNLILGPIHLLQLVKKDNLLTNLECILEEENIYEHLERKIKTEDLVDLKEKLIKILNEKENIKEKIKKLIEEEQIGDLSFIKHIITGGDVLPETLMNDTKKLLEKNNCFVEVTNGYGLTEACGVVGINPDRGRGKKEVVWFPLPDNEVLIFHKGTFEECRVNERGEICIKKNNNSSVMTGYKNNPEKTNNSLIKHPDGSIWLHTGDIGYIDEDGFVHNEGRIVDLIFKAGFKICPNTVENTILKHPMVLSCKVVGVDDNKFRTVPVAFLVLKDNSVNIEKLIEEIKELCVKELTYDYFTPDFFEVIEQMPLNNSGKPDKKVLKKRFEEKRNTEI